MNPWIYIGMGGVAAIVFVLLLWVVNIIMIKTTSSTSKHGLALMITAIIYTAYVTWAVTTKNLPFFDG